MPTWVKVAIDAWRSAAGVVDGYVFRSVNRADCVTGASLGEKVVWQLIKPYAEAAGVPGIAPHDLRRACAKLCRAGGDSTAARSRSCSNDGAVSRHEAGSGSRAERCDQVESDGIAGRVNPPETVIGAVLNSDEFPVKCLCERGLIETINKSGTQTATTP